MGARAGLGLTRWSETGQTVTPFMRWLDGSDVQFSYAAMLKGKRPGWGEFFTSNLSLKTGLLRRNRFDERFPAAAMEDIELGYRLVRQHELDVVFLADAVAWHLHPTSFEQACRRAEGVGGATHLFHELWPEQRPRATGPLQRSAAHTFHRNGWILSALTKLTGSLTSLWCPNPLIRPVLRLHSSRGYRDAAKQCAARGSDAPSIDVPYP